MVVSGHSVGAVAGDGALVRQSLSDGPRERLADRPTIM